MAFTRARYTDARGSSFTDVGRDHTTIVNQTNIFISSSTPEHIIHHLCKPRPVLSLPNSSLGTLSQGNALVSNSFSGASAVIGQTAQLILSIGRSLTQMLPESSDYYLDLKQQLDSLHQILTLTEFAVQAYENTPLGYSLATAINQEVELCDVVLQELFETVKGYRQGFSVWHSWSRILWRGSEIASLTPRLSARQQALEGCLKALDSIPWQELDCELRTGRLSLEDFHAILHRGPTSLRHIQLNAVLVVDHLGRTLPVPTIFCSSWKDFDYIINGYCKDRIGNCFIERGDYQVIRAQDNQMIGPSEFSSAVETGMVLEMTIVLRQRDAAQKTCPRCSHINANVSSHGGWIECRKCTGQFQVAKANEEINSPASGSHKRRRTNSEDPRQYKKQKTGGDPQECDNDGRQFFRRIYIVCTKFSSQPPTDISNFSNNPDLPWEFDGMPEPTGTNWGYYQRQYDSLVERMNSQQQNSDPSSTEHQPSPANYSMSIEIARPSEAFGDCYQYMEQPRQLTEGDADALNQFISPHWEPAMGGFGGLPGLIDSEIRPIQAFVPGTTIIANMSSPGFGTYVQRL